MQPLDPDPLVRGQVRITCTHECNTFFGKNLNTSNPRQVLHFYLEPAQFMRFRCYRLVEVLLVVLIYAVFENVLLRVNINPLPLMLFASINMRSAAVKNDSALGQSGYLLE